MRSIASNLATLVAPLVIPLMVTIPSMDAFIIVTSPMVVHQSSHQSSYHRHDDQPRSIIINNNCATSTAMNAAKATADENGWDIPDPSSLPPLYQSSLNSNANGNANNKGKGKSRSKPIKQLPNGGTITMVGSGPGDPNLLTVSAYKLLTEATSNTLVICDRLVSKEILDLISDDAEQKIARKLPGCANLAQNEIYKWAHEGLQKGMEVIRLKIGDPFVFGRGGEEVLQFRDYGIEPSVIPGVSAAFSAPLLGSIPVTHRGVANQVVMCTGYGREGTSPDLIQYHPEQTIVFLMAVGRLTELSERLQRLAGYPADTAVGIIERAGCPEQRTVVGDLSNIGAIAKEYNVQAPSTIVVGNVVRVLLADDDEMEGGEASVLQGLISTCNDTAAVSPAFAA
mmetsp:Transcript_9601/g.26118  ORF Transcript_9601/g.26118 Transcript_9601/m.26118 type:complete len:397 (-) Transcript_9601:160-1350(-)|eukprot:CAMPEP_0198111530 /NCGR_PEP_ID=MMETSP1442-20131203/3503_1 /TAXON_ID= /ORGANISM="Craspedostauros australis, Strain CCMP3328" /LENGTH=396 /DNA_ID=CAMNT_0043768007 /DNA_START=278 /DNA_END=1468 /DNA_ORIENTATION=-